MELGIFSRTYEYSDPGESFGRMSAHGFSHTQLNLSNGGMPTLPERLDEGKLLELKRVMDAHGIKAHALSGTFNMIDPDSDAKERGIRQFKLQCEIAAMLQIPVVTLCTGSKNRKNKWAWHDDNLKESSWSELMESTGRILRFAEDSGVRLGVETEVANVICTAQRARRYLDEFKSPRLKIIMDGANLFTAENASRQRQVLDEAFSLLGEDIILAHAKDMRPAPDGEMQYMAPGLGALDFEYYLSLLTGIGYEGALIMHGLSEGEIPQSRKYLEALI